MSPDVLAQARRWFEALRAAENLLELQLRAAAILARVLGGLRRTRGGGGVGGPSTGGAYLSRGVDLIVHAEPAALRERLEAVGLERRGSAWVHRELDVAVDFPPLLWRETVPA